MFCTCFCGFAKTCNTNNKMHLTGIVFACYKTINIKKSIIQSADHRSPYRILSLWSSRIYLSDYTRVLCIVSSLLLLGLLFVYSSSIFYSERYFGDPHRFFFQQLLFACFGFVLMMIISFIHYCLNLFLKFLHLHRQ